MPSPGTEGAFVAASPKALSWDATPVRIIEDIWVFSVLMTAAQRRRMPVSARGMRRPDVLEVRGMALPGRLSLPSFYLGKASVPVSPAGGWGVAVAKEVFQGIM
jgi:hypothetical protein